MSRQLASLALTLAIATNGFAAEKWTSVRSSNFVLAGNATESQIHAVAVELEQFREAFTRFLGMTPKAATVPITVIVFRNDEAYRPFKPLAEGQSAPVAGYFQASEDANYVAVAAGSPIPKAVYHQYVHELTRDIPNTVPLWFTEGLAEFFSSFEISTKEKQFVVGKVVPEHIETLRKTGFVALADLFAFDRRSSQYNERERKSVYYAQSWALVNYLVVGQNGARQSQIGPFLGLINEGKSAVESFQLAFKSDYSSMLGELERYVRTNGDWTGRAAVLKEKSAIERDIKVRILSEAETEFQAGDLLLHMNRLPEAEMHLKQAITLEPRLAPALSAMGMARYRQDNVSEAINYLKQAIDSDPQYYLGQYYYAYVLDKNSTSPRDDLDAKRASAGKAIEVAPQYVPAYELLAYINLTADIDYNGTIELLEKAFKFAPGNANLRFLLAQALVKREDFEQAGKILNLLVDNSAVDASIRDGAHNLINYIARLREAGAKKTEIEATAPAPTPAPIAKEPEKEVATPSVETAPPTSRSKIGELIPLTPQRSRPEGPQIKGMLTLVDCRNGLTLTVKSQTQTLRLHSDTPEKIQFLSYVATVNTSISCGPVPGQGIPVVITYRPTPGAATAGDPLIVEFVEN